MPQSSFSLEIKGVDASAGTFEGLAAVYGNIDHENDVILPGAFTKTLKDHGGKVPILYQHYHSSPIGMGELTDSAGGLHIKGELVLEVSKARESYALMKREVLKGLSIGYSTVVSEYDRDKDIRYLKELRLHEVSLVTFPMNLQAQVTDVKRFDEMTVDELLIAAKSKALPDEILVNLKKLQALVTGQAAETHSAPDIHAVNKATSILKLFEEYRHG